MQFYLYGFSLSLILLIISVLKRPDVDDMIKDHDINDIGWRMAASFALVLVVGLTSWIGVFGMTKTLIRGDK